MTGEYCATFEHGQTFGDYPLVVTYGTKHATKFGQLRDIRPTTDDDPSHPFRLVWRLFDSSPARQRYLIRQHDKRHPDQALLIPDLFVPAGQPTPRIAKPRPCRAPRINAQMREILKAHKEAK